MTDDIVTRSQQHGTRHEKTGTDEEYIEHLENEVANFKWLAQRRLEELELIANGSESSKAKALIAYYQNHRETF